jgi:hypothetical protein
LFYITLVFALVARYGIRTPSYPLKSNNSSRLHPWLIAGALASALTYSGVAAIHACLLIWHGSSVAELDLFALLGLLSTSCIIAVPLINWSSTLRHLGQDKGRSNSDEKSDGNTRTVIIWWAFLVAVGFLSAWVGFTFNDSLPVAVSADTSSGLESLSCVPPNGVLNQSAGQIPGWHDFWITAEFVDINNCQEPCSTSTAPWGGNTLFRSPGDLQTLTKEQINRNIELTDITHREVRASKFVSFYVTYMLFSVPYVILQGAWHVVMFGRSSPQKARYTFYYWITRIHWPNGKARTFQAGKIQRGFALTVSILVYLWALFILIICPPIFITNIVATEIGLYTLPQGESNTHIGQWGPMAGTILILLAAFIARFEHSAYKLGKRALINFGWYVSHWWKHCRSGRHKRDKLGEYDDINQTSMPSIERKASTAPDPDLVRDTRSDIWDLVSDFFDQIKWYFQDFGNLVEHEVKVFKDFWEKPDAPPNKRTRPPKPKSRRNRKLTAIRNAALRKASEAGSENDTPDYEVDNPYASNINPPKHRPKGNKRYHVAPYESQLESEALRRSTYSDMENFKPAQKKFNNARAGRSVAFAQTEAERKRRSMAVLPPLPSGSSSPIRQSHENNQNNEESRVDEALSEHSDNISPDDAVQIQQLENEEPHPTVLSSLSESISHRARRSHVYSPELSPLAADAKTNMQNLASPDEVQPQPKLQTPARVPSSHSHSDLIPIHTEFQSTTNPSTSAHSSYLFTETELARIYGQGTPPVPSLVTSPEASVRNSMAIANVSYLQVRTPPTPDLGDEIVLRKDRQGQWVLVQRNGDLTGDGKILKEITEEEEKEKEREENKGGGGGGGGSKRKSKAPRIGGRLIFGRSDQTQAQTQKEESRKYDQGW